MRLAGLGAMMMAAACTGIAPPPPAIAKPAVKPIRPDPEDVKFARFVKEFKAEAIKAGIEAAIYDAAMAKAERLPKVTQRNLDQPEFVKPVWTYLDSAVSDRRIADGKARIAENAAMLARVEARFGVRKEILVAIWGMETHYGRFTGGHNIFSALATLAYDGPRADYARAQLIAALKLMQQQHFAAADMTASWAGAFGQTQFVPTTFLAKAVDGDGDGKIDIWRSPADALASSANLLVRAGWQAGQPWGFEVKLPGNFAFHLADLSSEKPITEWAALGVKKADGTPIVGQEAAAIYLPAGSRGPAVMVLANFKTVLRYNNAASYALGVCLLADRLRDAPALSASWPRDDPPMSRSANIALQEALNALGHDVGKIDGLIGGRTRAAIRAWQAAQGLPADGYAAPDHFARIVMEAKKKKN